MAEQIVNRIDLSKALDDLYGSQVPLFSAKSLAIALRGYAEKEVGLGKPVGDVLINMADVIQEKIEAALQLQGSIETNLMAANRSAAGSQSEQQA